MICNGIARVGAALDVQDLRGAIVVRQCDPTNPTNANTLGLPYYLDPTDMGILPTMVAVGDLLGPFRAAVANAAQENFATTGVGTPLTSFAPAGTPDILVANTGDSSLTFYFQLQGPTYSGGVETPPIFGSANLPMKDLNSAIPAGDTIGIAIGDLNGDGANDFVVIGQLSQTAIIFLFEPDPTKWLVPLASGGLLPFRVGGILPLPQILAGRPAIADFNSDAMADIAVASRLTNEVLLFMNQGTTATGEPIYGAPLHLAADLQCFDVKALDLNGDLRTDLVAANHLSIDLSVYYQTSAGTLSERFVPVPAGQQPSVMAAGPLTGDGSIQIAVPMTGDNTVVIFQPDPIASLSVLKTYSLALPGVSEPFEARVVDVDGDGKPDVLVAMQIALDGSGGVSGAWEFVKGNPLSAAVTDLQVGTVPSAAQFVTAGAFSGSPAPDVALSFAQANEVQLFYSQVGGGYTNTTTIPMPSPRQLFITDLDGDGLQDLVIPVGGGVWVIYGKAGVPGGLDLANIQMIDTSAAVDAVGANVADVNNDGAKDIILGGFVSANAAVLYQDPVVVGTAILGARTFHLVPLLGVVAPTTQVAVGVLSSSGLPDVAMCWPSANLVAVYYQNPHATGFSDALLPPVTYTTAADPFGCAIVDVDGNGKNDLVVSARGANSLNIFFQR